MKEEKHHSCQNRPKNRPNLANHLLSLLHPIICFFPPAVSSLKENVRTYVKCKLRVNGSHIIDIITGVCSVIYTIHTELGVELFEEKKSIGWWIDNIDAYLDR
jgi:hypothetical protein